MAKKSKIARNEQRRELIERYAEKRAELKKTIASPDTAPEEVTAAVQALARLPRDSSPTRYRNRDAVDGRPRGYVGKVGLSRVRFRQEAHHGNLPGITKSSW